MLRPLFPQNPPRPGYLRNFQCSIAPTLHPFLCTCQKSLTPSTHSINATQFSAICYKTDILKNALTSRKTPLVIRISTFFRHWSLVIRHCPRPSDIKPSMKYLVLLLTLLSLSCGGSGTSVNQADQSKQTFTSNPLQSAQQQASSDPLPSIPKDAEWTILCATFT